MRTYCFPSNNRWMLFVDEKTRWLKTEDEIPDPFDIISVLNDVKSEFEKIFDMTLVNQYDLSVLSSFDTPSAFSDQQIIFLTAKGRRWAQYVYQFSHELCHFIIHSNVPVQMRWFEESVCELASIFLLDKLSIKWATDAPYSNWISYAPYFSEYRKEQQNNAVTLPVETSFAKYICSKIEMLSKMGNCYHRNINTLCANNLLPVFEENPSLWIDIPQIKQIPAGLDFYDSLLMWKNLSQNKEAIQKIIELFTV